MTALGNSRVQERYGINAAQRMREGYHAMTVLDLTNVVYPFPDDTPDWESLRVKLSEDADLFGVTKAWTPLPEPGGHEQHNIVSAIALGVFGEDRLSFYATYRRGSARTRTETEVTPEPHWPALKFKAMACYESQINLDNTRFWFTTDWDKEWIA